MANSLITRCPKCSTAFRVSDDVLSMAKGKVRCGQCFHIFDASTPTTHNKVQPDTNRSTQTEPLAKTASDSAIKAVEPNTGEEDINPDWLDTLLDDEETQASNKAKQNATPELAPKNTDIHASKAEDNTHSEESYRYKETSPPSSANTFPVEEPSKAPSAEKKQNEPAPWEVELAEVEAALKAAPADPQVSQHNTAPPPRASARKVKTAVIEEPDYMTALHSLAQTAAEQTHPSDLQAQHSILDQLSAQQSLGPLLDESTEQPNEKKTHSWLWLFASMLGLSVLLAQVTTQYFEEGSRSSNFRALYQTICSYSGCVLPTFEDVSAVSIQHVRIQSHPSIENALLVNAIITNTSAFSQPMPKIALEFFDLNGLPVAARLFAPSDYLHKDFLDITYMPPNTPIHLVIPIHDPGARAVTHQLKAFPTDTRSY
ncbi:zinc-ribbon and DUF3426 domain-containing protein [Marinomonas sp. IMCC 4694]|uniref:zinc-ribbon and DUF3426 domain-containing protein n=1 Tax=Marinomonas sp. IMCC 4694 TaxID=2605432 RepID=UPI0011E77422|nr:zinc-ribbon and DUF3426 domain-containing protein [Marinomonas sp. IMCC 4694]TYL48270.1 DUF3426 domain-containing protein [Marinomonas sp. IMCC 4694]